MNIPKNGRVVIVDNDYNEVASLIQILSQEGIAFTYFTGEVDQLPDEPLRGITHVFMDLELDKYITDENKASQDISVLQRILGESAKDRTVVIIIWSGALSIKDEFVNRMRQAQISPLKLLEIAKADCKDGGEFIYEKIFQQIEQRLSDVPALSLLVTWDNMVGQASNYVYRNTLLCDSDRLTDINKHLNSVYIELAEAKLGKENVTDESTDATLYVLDLILSNEISNLLLGYDTTSHKLDLENKTPLNLSTVGALNANVSLCKSLNSHLPGSIFVEDYGNQKINFEDLFGKDFNTASTTYKDQFDKILHVCCEITPLCDYALNRHRLNRGVSGAIIPTSIKKLLKRTEYFYFSPPLVFDGFFNGEPFIIVFDLRLLFTVAKGTFSGNTPVFRIGETMLMHIQNRLGNQVSNPGIIRWDNYCEG